MISTFGLTHTEQTQSTRHNTRIVRPVSVLTDSLTTDYLRVALEAVIRFRIILQAFKNLNYFTFYATVATPMFSCG